MPAGPPPNDNGAAEATPFLIGPAGPVRLRAVSAQAEERQDSDHDHDQTDDVDDGIHGEDSSLFKT